MLSTGCLTERALVVDGERDEMDREERVPAALHWYALYTKSHCERLVEEQLAAKGFQCFLPTIEAWSRRGGIQRFINVPMFPGYLFLHRAMDKTSHVEILKARGLVRILGERWDRLAVVPDESIEMMRKVLRACVPALHFPYLREGQRVRMTDGPLANVEGIFVRGKPGKGLVVISIHLLHRSVAVEVDCTLVAAA